MKDCNTCNVPTEKRKCQNITSMDIASCNLEIKPEVLARLIQTGQLTLNDLRCTDNHTKQFVQAVMLNCILCKSSSVFEQKMFEASQK